jgi:hypothetical protein
MIRRRQVLAAVITTTVAGCGETNDAEGTQQNDPERDNDPDDATPTEADEEGVVVATDFDSYAVDTELRQEQEGSATMIHDSQTDWDLANDRASRRYELRESDEEEGEGLITEIYTVGDTTYRIVFDSCTTTTADLIYPGQLSGIAVPVGEDLESSESAERVGTDTVDGEPVDVWRYDLTESMNVFEGEARFSVSAETGYLLLSEGSYEFGSGNNPTVITFSYRQHSFDQTFDIEVPENCRE